MSIREACISVFTNWKNFHGRACRSEFWCFCFILLIGGFLISIIETILHASIEGFPTILTYALEYRDKKWNIAQNPTGLLSLIFNAIILFPFLSLTSRRLQDRSISGWWQLSYFTIVGIFVIFILLMLRAKEDENKWGRNPLLDRKN
tara:strand:+ start:1342 stop:1782 length:441 start_codon:yes stop_codon:yes gene_type:complete